MEAGGASVQSQLTQEPTQLPPTPTAPQPSPAPAPQEVFFSSLQRAELPRRKMQSPKGMTSSTETGSAKEGVLFLPEGVL